jgi:hypothetical protein
MITLEEALGINGVTITPEPKKETSPKQTLKASPSPPDRVDLLLDIITVRQQLKELLAEIAEGSIKADKELSARIYIMQQIVYTNKTALDAMKEPITLTQNNITQIKHVVKFVKPARAKADNSDD